MIFFSASHIIFNLLLTRNGSYIIGSLCRVATAQAINVRCRLKQRKKFEPWKVYVATQILYLKRAVIIAITGIAHPSPLIAC